MSFLDLVRFAAGNLWRRKTRTFLTVLGVFIGTACITIMVSLSLGNLEQFNEQIMQNTNLTRIEIYQSGQNKLNDSAVDSFKQIPGVKNATGIRSLPAYIEAGKYICSSSLTVADPEAMDFEFMEGELFSSGDALELVIGFNARDNFYDPHDTSGYSSYYYGSGAVMIEADSVDMTERQVGPDIDWLDVTMTYYPNWGDPEDEEFTPENPAPKSYKTRVSGILSQADDEASYQIFISPEAAQKIYTQNRQHFQAMGYQWENYDQAYVNCTDVDAVTGVLTTLKDMGYQCYSPTEWINDMREEQARQQSQLVAIGMVSLIVSAIGIANTMLASILERRREIGVMKVIGLSVHKINLMFLVEAALIGLLGGLIGIGISYGLSWILASGQTEISFLGMYFDQGVRMSIPWWLALGSVAIAVLVGVISGIYPAWKATRMSPLEAIRGAD